MRVLICVFFLVIPLWSSAQIDWIYDFNLAKSIAVQKDQLILVDFWARWCGPCKTMDRELWSSEEAARLSEHFVPLKVDIDTERSMAMKYAVQSIPMVVLMTANGEVVWQRVGYSSPGTYLRILEQLPESLNGLNAELFRPEISDFDMGLAYQAAGMAIEKSLGKDLLYLSDKHFQQAGKTEDPEMEALAELHQILNNAFAGRYKKAMKQLSKREFPDTKKVKELKLYVEAYCYKCQGKDEQYKEARSTISNQEYLEQLETTQQN